MRAPKMSIFETAANLELWPKILPHYRYIHYLERSPGRNIVVMAAKHAGLNLDHLSEHAIDANLAAVSERAARYLDWPMLLLMKLI